MTEKPSPLSMIQKEHGNMNGLPDLRILQGKYYAVIKLVKDGLTVSAPSDGFFIINIIPDRSTTPSSVSVSLSVGTVVMEGTYE